MIFTTDHGLPMPHMKCNLYDTGIGVALILRLPDGTGRGTATDALVSQIDLFPTICDLTGLPKPDWLQGKSMLPVIRDPKARIREEIYSEVTYHAAYEPMRCVRTDRYKLIRYYSNRQTCVPSNIDDSCPKSLLIENGYLSQIRSREMLFDLWLDPIERVNLIDNPLYIQVYSDLSSRLEKWMTETNDPLRERNRNIAAPEGACIVPEDFVSVHKYRELLRSRK